MIEYDICYKSEAFSREKGYIYPPSIKFSEAKKNFIQQETKLYDWEFNIDRSKQNDEYENFLRHLHELRLRIWISDIPFLKEQLEVKEYYIPSNEKSTLKSMLYTQGKEGSLFASMGKFSDGQIHYFFLESTYYENEAQHRSYREISYDDFLKRLGK